nr:helix-turn-helix domain-containing protein [Leptospira ilyithenensis]
MQKKEKGNLISGGLLILPDGSIDLVFDLKKNRIYFVGTMSRSQLISPEDIEHSYGIRFVPGFAGIFLNLPANEITNQRMDVTIPDFQNSDLLEKLSSVSSPDQGASLLFLWIKEKTKSSFGNPIVLEFVKQIRRNPFAVQIEEMANTLGITRQHLSRLSRQYIGLDAKTFYRTQRLQSMICLVKKNEVVSGNWAALALEFGYFDQSHFIHDFKDLVGITPKKYFSKDVPFLQY